MCKREIVFVSLRACVRARRSCVRFCWLVFQVGNGRAVPCRGRGVGVGVPPPRQRVVVESTSLNPRLQISLSATGWSYRYTYIYFYQRGLQI